MQNNNKKNKILNNKKEFTLMDLKHLKGSHLKGSGTFDFGRITLCLGKSKVPDPFNMSLQSKRGFTLIEMLVATALFSAVMLIGVGALLSLIDANKKAQALNSVMNNLNFAVESMSRKIRVGTIYHCEFSNSVPPPNISQPQDCSFINGGGKLLAFESSGGDPSDSGDQIVYRINGTHIEKSKNGGIPGTFIDITAPEVTIENFSFFVDGTSVSDNLQPKVVIIIRGTAGTKEKYKTEFNLQTMVSQRVLDL